jgi:hypothetical protein
MASTTAQAEREANAEMRPLPKALLPFRVLKQGGVVRGLEYDQEVTGPDGAKRVLPFCLWTEAIWPVLRLMEMYAELERMVDELIAARDRYQEEMIHHKGEAERLQAKMEGQERIAKRLKNESKG